MAFYPLIQQPKDIATLQNPDEFNQVLQEFVDLNPKNVLEIGTWQGGTSWYFKHYAPEARVVTIDLDPQVDVTAYGVEQVVGDSKEVNAYQIMPEIDFLFIDGDHSYFSVWSDFQKFAPLVRPGGLIALHDISQVGYKHGNPANAWTHQVHLFWERLRRAGFKMRSIEPEGDIIGTGIVYVEKDLCTRINGL